MTAHQPVPEAPANAEAYRDDLVHLVEVDIPYEMNRLQSMKLEGLEQIRQELVGTILDFLYTFGKYLIQARNWSAETFMDHAERIALVEQDQAEQESPFSADELELLLRVCGEYRALLDEYRVALERLSKAENKPVSLTSETQKILDGGVKTAEDAIKLLSSFETEPEDDSEEQDETDA